MFSQASNAELQESNTRLESVTKALEGMMECQVCFNQFDNKERRSVYLVPCRHMYADHNSCRTSYELVVCKTCANNSRNPSDICIHACIAILVTLQPPSLFVDRVTDFSATFKIVLTTYDH